MTKPKGDVLRELLERPFQPYWQAVGRFISGFSLLEVNMQLALWTFAHLSKPMARALLSGSTRIDAAMTLISKIAEAEKWSKEKKSEWDCLSTQLGIINKVRNDLLHFGANRDDDGDDWTISNKIFATSEDQIRITKINVQTLSDLSADVTVIMMRLVLLAWGDEMKDETKESFEDAKRIPWRYKSQQQAGGRRKSQKKHPKQPRPPKS